MCVFDYSTRRRLIHVPKSRPITAYRESMFGAWAAVRGYRPGRVYKARCLSAYYCRPRHVGRAAAPALSLTTGETATCGFYAWARPTPGIGPIPVWIWGRVVVDYDGGRKGYRAQYMKYKRCPDRISG